jgi:hypothetical protein
MSSAGTSTLLALSGAICFFPYLGLVPTTFGDDFSWVIAILPWLPIPESSGLSGGHPRLSRFSCALRGPPCLGGVAVELNRKRTDPDRLNQLLV